jgi:hypothetical protein
VGGFLSAVTRYDTGRAAHGMNLGKIFVRMNVRVWNREKVANGIIDTTRQPHSILL